MTYTVIFSAPAEADLFAIYDYIAERAGGASSNRLKPIASVLRTCPNAAPSATICGWDYAPWASAAAQRFCLKSIARRGG
jgi:hypothetical protein